MKHLLLAVFLLYPVAPAFANSDVLKDENLLDLDNQISEPLRQQQERTSVEVPEESEPNLVENHGDPCDPARTECLRPYTETNGQTLFR
ncbi:MAG: hypothetical protein KDD51_00755 [Bdellovibrionales bacterium]|nr:hypothetical protein [Bdellovibrionales bacterium]